MHRSNTRRVLLSGLLVLLVLGPQAWSVHAETVTYQITNLGTLGGPTSLATAINNKGQIAGISDLPGGKRHHAFLWHAHVLTDLGGFGGRNSVATGINNQGDVVGIAQRAQPGDGTAHFCEDPTQSCRAVLWKGGVLHDLGTLGGLSSQALGINDHDQVVGNSETSQAGQGPGFLWQKGRMTKLGNIFDQYSAAGAVAINNGGEILGIFATLDGSHHAYLWDGHKMTDLGAGNGTASDGYSLNDQGQVVGGIVLADNVTTHAFEWQKGTIRNLPTFPGDQGSVANVINDAGVVVGSSYKGQTFSRAVLWRGGQVVDLNTLIPAGSGWHLEDANGINLQGQIVGQGTYQGKRRAFLMTPLGGH